MKSIKDRYEGLVVDYKDKEKVVVKLQAEKEVAEKEIKKIEAEIKKLIKDEPAKLDSVIERLAKGMEAELDALSGKVVELEGKISEMKVGESEEVQVAIRPKIDILGDLDDI